MIIFVSSNDFPKNKSIGDAERAERVIGFRQPSLAASLKPDDPSK